MGGSGCFVGEPITVAGAGRGMGSAKGLQGRREGDLLVMHAEVMRQQTSRVEGLDTCARASPFFTGPYRQQGHPARSNAGQRE